MHVVYGRQAKRRIDSRYVSLTFRAIKPECHMSVNNLRPEGAKNAVVRRFKSSAFRYGLCLGFGAPALFFMPGDMARAAKFDASVGAAWKSVGKTLSNATRKGARQLGKTTGKTGK